jgi:hypothetical protein
MNDVIFWYTGWVIWAVIAIIIALATLLGAIIVVARGYHRSKEWLGLKALYYLIDRNELELLRDIFNPIPNEIDADVLIKFAAELKARKLAQVQLPRFEDDTKRTMLIAEFSGQYKHDMPFSEWLRDLIDASDTYKRSADSLNKHLQQTVDALDDAQSVVDPAEDEDVAYENVLKSARMALDYYREQETKNKEEPETT